MSDAAEIEVIAGRPSLRYWRDLWEYREIFWYLSWRDVLVRYKQTAIGVAWSVLRPLLNMAAFTLVFGLYYAYSSDGATPHNLVRPAIGGVLAGLLLGALLGWVISSIANSFKPRAKKMAGVKNQFAEEE